MKQVRRGKKSLKRQHVLMGVIFSLILAGGCIITTVSRLQSSAIEIPADVPMITAVTTTKSIPEEEKLTTTAEKVITTTKQTIMTESTTATVNTTTIPETTTPEEIIIEEHIYGSVFDSINYYPTDYELNMMCAVVSSETGYCEDQAQKAVAHTLINRVLSDDFPNTLYGVTTQENQYTAIDCYFTGNYRSGLEPGSEGWNHTMELCKEALVEYDFTNGAVAYYNPNMIGYNSWFESLQFCYQDQYGRFFKLW